MNRNSNNNQIMCDYTRRSASKSNEYSSVSCRVARYVANFTLPTTEFPNHGPLPMPADIGHAVGDLERIRNPAGHVTQYTQYDRAGRVRQMIDPKGVVTVITYTPRGWVNTVTATAPGGAGRITSYTYDGVGQLTGVVQPDGTTLSYNYDAAHRLVGVTDAKGNSVNYTLDNVANRSQKKSRTRRVSCSAASAAAMTL